MDNLCHTLVGAAIGEAGLKHKTRLATATLMVASNLPDIDVVVFATDTPSVAFRRGWTHGVGAQVLLPLLLAALVWLIARRRSTEARATPVRMGWIVALSYIGLYSHVGLDYLNTYGIRLLTPFDWRWFYGDAVFIIDPWLWLMIGLGVWLSLRWGRAAPARVSLVVAASYIAGMVFMAQSARATVIDAWRQAHGREPSALMVGPVPLDPLRREVIVDAGEHYQRAAFFWPRTVQFSAEHIPKNDRAPEVGEARRAPEVRGFLVWSRFPFWRLEPTAGGMRVTVTDARFMARGGMFSASAVVVRSTSHDP